MSTRQQADRMRITVCVYVYVCRHTGLLSIIFFLQLQLLTIKRSSRFSIHSACHTWKRLFSINYGWSLISSSVSTGRPPPMPHSQKIHAILSVYSQMNWSYSGPIVQSPGNMDETNWFHLRMRMRIRSFVSRTNASNSIGDWRRRIYHTTFMLFGHYLVRKSFGWESMQINSGVHNQRESFLFGFPDREGKSMNDSFWHVRRRLSEPIRALSHRINFFRSQHFLGMIA